MVAKNDRNVNYKMRTIEKLSPVTKQFTFIPVYTHKQTHTLIKLPNSWTLLHTDSEFCFSISGQIIQNL